MRTNTVLRWILPLGACAFLTLGAASTADAKPKKAPKQKPDLTASKDSQDATRPPGDRGANDGAQGRRNATEDAARAAEGPANDRRP